jgi:hypothetical protein
MRMHLTAVLPALVLAGCLFSSGPSQDEALKAVVMFGEGNAAAQYKYTHFILGECKEAVGKPGYSCEVSWVYNGAFSKRGSARFVKDGSTWRVAEEE